MWKKVAVFAISTLLCTGCYHIQDPAANQVSQTIYERSGFEVSWDRKVPACKEEVIARLVCEPLSAESAIQIALLNSPKIQVLFEEVGIAQSDLVNASLIANPIFDIGVRFPESSLLPTWNTEIDAVQPIVNILLQPIRKQTASLQLAQTMASVTSELFQFIEMVATTYYTTQGAMVNLEWQRQKVEALELAYLVSQRQIDVGNTSELDVDIHYENYQDALLVYEEMKIAANTLRQQLAQMMGLFDFDLCLKIQRTEPVGIPQEELILFAYENRYDLLAKRLATESIATSMGLYQWYAYSEFAAGIAYEKDADGSITNGPGFALAAPIFNFGQGDRMRTRALLGQNVQMTRDLCLQIKQEVATFYEGMDISQKRATQLIEDVIPGRQDLIGQTLRFYNFMNASVYDLLAAKIVEINAQMMLVDSQRDYLVYRAQLIRTLGGMVP